MKKSAITISFDEDKLSALRMYLSQKNATVESELEKMLVPCIQKPFLPESVTLLK